MIRLRIIRKRSFLTLEALPPDLRDLTRSRQPRLLAATARAVQVGSWPSLAPESALRLHPCRALSTAPVRTSIEARGYFAKIVVVANTIGKVIDARHKGYGAHVFFNCPVGHPFPSITENGWVKTW